MSGKIYIVCINLCSIYPNINIVKNYFYFCNDRLTRKFSRKCIPQVS